MRIDLSNGHKVVVKKNLNNYPDLFRIEAEALKVLRETVDRLKKSDQLRIPKPIAYYDKKSTDENLGENPDEKNAYSYLIMEYLPPALERHNQYRSSKSSSSENPYFLLGKSLAAIHQDQVEKNYGWKEDNYLGSTIQTNKAEGDEKHLWSAFFLKKRITPLVEKCLEKRLLSKADETLVSRCISTGYKLLSPLDEDRPSLVHGDMWGGNVFISSHPTNKNALPCLIDPALHYGHREVDIAMSELFGRLDENFYKSYQEAYPLKKGYELRRDFHNLYHLLNHLLLFGGSYHTSVIATLKKYA